MAILQSCCCWRTVRQGSFASAFYTASYFALTMIMMASFLHEEHQYLTRNSTMPQATSILEPDTISHTTMGISIIVLCSSTCGFITSLLLIYGLTKDKRLWLIPWIFTVVVATAVDLVHCIYIFVIETLRFNPITAILFTVDFFLISLNVYSFLCVVSQYQEYKAGRGTAQYYIEHAQLVPSVQYTAPSTATSCLTSTARRCPSLCAANAIDLHHFSPPSPRTSRRPSTKRVQFPDTMSSDRRGSVLSRAGETGSTDNKSPIFFPTPDYQT